MIKWLDDSVVYPIADIKWASLIQYVLKKGSITIVPNEKNKVVQIRSIMG